MAIMAIYVSLLFFIQNRLMEEYLKWLRYTYASLINTFSISLWCAPSKAIYIYVHFSVLLLSLYGY